MDTDFMVACTVTGVTPSLLQAKYGVARRNARFWVAGVKTPPPEIRAWVLGVYAKFLANVNRSIEYLEKVEDEHGEPEAVDLYLYRSQKALAIERHFETVEMQNRCAVFTGEVLKTLGYEVVYKWVGDEE